MLWADLERGLAMTLPALGEAYLVISTKVGNRFVQFASHPKLGLRAETVSDEYLEPGERHTPAQIAALLALGWTPPTHRSDAPAAERKKPPNYFRDWEPAVPWDEAARLAVKTLRALGVCDPKALEYDAFDAAQRPMSLQTLRIARRVK